MVHDPYASILDSQVKKNTNTVEMFKGIPDKSFRYR